VHGVHILCGPAMHTNNKNGVGCEGIVPISQLSQRPCLRSTCGCFLRDTKYLGLLPALLFMLLLSLPADAVGGREEKRIPGEAVQSLHSRDDSPPGRNLLASGNEWPELSPKSVWVNSRWLAAHCSEAVDDLSAVEGALLEL